MLGCDFPVVCPFGGHSSSVSEPTQLIGFPSWTLVELHFGLSLGPYKKCRVYLPLLRVGILTVSSEHLHYPDYPYFSRIPISASPKNLMSFLFN